MFILKIPIFKQWFVVSKPGLLAFTYLDTLSESNDFDFNSKCFIFQYNYIKHLLSFLHRATKCLNNEKDSDFEEKLDTKTYGGFKNGKIYFKNINCDFVFEEDDTFILFISGLIYVLPSLILPNKTEVQWFLKNSFDEDTLFFKVHEKFITQWQLLIVLHNKLNNDKE